MTKRQKSSRRVAGRGSRFWIGRRKQEPGIVEREIADKVTGIKQLTRLPNRAKSRWDRTWNRTESGRMKRIEARQVRRRRLQKSRIELKAWRHELKKKLRMEVRRHMRKAV
jgi:hypothetical protein